MGHGAIRAHRLPAVGVDKTPLLVHFRSVQSP